MPNSPNAHSISAAIPPENTRSRNSDTATIGSAARCSIATNAIPPAAATANAVRIDGEVQPRPLPSISAQVSVVSATADTTRPGTSSRLRSVSRDSLIAQAPSAIVASPTGTLISKIHGQEACCESRPPSSGPTARARPPTPAQMPTAAVRSRGSR